MKFRRILKIILILSTSYFIAFAQTNKDEITIASEPDYPPYCIIDENGNPDGFAVELFKASADAMKIKINIKIGVWDKIKQDLAEGKIDALPLVGKTPERENLFSFTFPYISLHGAVFVEKNTQNINSIHSLGEKVVAVMKGDNAEEYIRRHNISNNIFTTNTFEEAFRLLSEKKVDAVITQRVMGLKLINQLKLDNIIALDFNIPDFRQDFCFAVKKGNDSLLNKLNEGLSIVIANGTFNKLHQKWFGAVIKPEITFADVIRIGLFIFIPLLLIFSLILILILRREIRRKTINLTKEIEEHKNTVQLLNRQKLLLTEMEKVTKVGGWEFEVASKNIQWTDGTYDIHDLTRNDYDPSSIKQNINFYEGDDQILINESFNKTLNTGDPYDLELKFVTAKGNNKWVRTAGKADIQDGKIVRVFGNIMDITEQKEKEEELKKFKQHLEILITERTKELEEKVTKLRQSELAMLYMVEDLNNTNQRVKNEHKQLEIANRELEAFSYSVSHDLRAPIRAINGFINMLYIDHYKKLDDDAKVLIKDIIKNVSTMGKLIDDLLEFSRLGRREMKKDLIDMKNLFESSFLDMKNYYKSDNIKFEIADLPKANADASLIKQVVINLISNAVKFTSRTKNPKITVNSYLDKNEVIYSITDNGVGFDMRYVHKIFGVFQRLHQQEEFEGNGVGLAIVNRIIQRHNGKVWAKSEINQGATFYFSLPHILV